MKKDKKILILSFVTAATTVIAGILHLQMAPGSLSQDLGRGILFLVGGILQVFWAVPVIKQWGRMWQIIGIVGTLVLVILWFDTHIHSMHGGPPGGHPSGNMSRGNLEAGEFPRGAPPRGMGVEIGGIMIPPIEMLQIAFIGLYAILSKIISKVKTNEK
jgi:hypothetical protein